MPASGIGRVAKCGKEEIVGLLTALRIFLEQDHDQVHGRWLALCRDIAAGLEGIAGAELALIERNGKGVPEVQLKLDQARLGLSAARLIKQLQDGDPSVHVNHARAREDMIVLGPTCLREGDVELLVKRIRAELGATR